jgi:hypothetical protein
MKKQHLTAKTLRVALTVTIFLLIGLAAAGFYFGQGLLRDYAVEVSRIVADSNASRSDVQSLQTLQKELEERKDIATKADSIVASGQDYQNQAITDLKRYAEQTGVAISQYSFAAPATAVAPPPTSGTAVAASGQPTVTVTLESPLSYSKLLAFISAIESNLPKMQVSSITLGRVDGNSDTIRTEQLTIEVYSQ